MLKAGLWTFGALAAVLTGAILYDDPLEPAPGLEFSPSPPPDPGENGFQMLSTEWLLWPPADWKMRQRWDHMLSGRSPWEDTVAASLVPPGQNPAASLRTALAAPFWEIPPQPFLGPADREEHDKRLLALYRGFQALLAESLRDLFAGNPASALDAIAQFRKLAARQTEHSVESDGLQRAFTYEDRAARLTAIVLTSPAARSEAILEKLRACWAEDGFQPAHLIRPAAGESLRLSRELASDWPYPYDSSWRKLYLGALTKPNRTKNRLNRALSAIQQTGLATPSSRERSLYAVMEADAARFEREESFPGLNTGGAAFANFSFYFGPAADSYAAGVFLDQPRLRLFMARTLRTAIAIKRYECRDGRKMPETLAELVPEYLTKLEVDPWNAQPLGWAATAMTLYGTGGDWKQEPPDPAEIAAAAEGIGYRRILGGESSPGLYLGPLAPPPSPPPPSSNMSGR